MKSSSHYSRSSWLLFTGVLLGFIFSFPAHAQLQWGIDGGGGSGAWNTSSANWWNGTSNAVWDGGTAVFGGTGGMVTSFNFGPNATGLTFNSPGYSIQSGWINARNPTSSAFDFVVTTNEAAAISSTLSSGANQATLVKRGSAALTIEGTNFIRNVRVEEGEYLVGGNSTLFFSNVVLANSAGVNVTLGQTSPSAEMMSLAGGGTVGGLLQPSNQARTVTATIRGSGTFGGIAQDNGAGKLALDFLSGDNFNRLGGPLNALIRAVPTVLGTEILTNSNTYSGPTTVSIGNTELSENGSVLNSAMFVSTFGTLRLNNSATAHGNRVSDTLDLTIKGGRLEFIGHGSTAIEEQIGTLKFSGATTISGLSKGAGALLTFAGAERQNRGTIDFSGDARVKWTGMTNNATGILGAYATAGDDWAATGADGRAEALTAYATDLNAASITDHVKLAAVGSVSLAASATRATLNLQNKSGANGTLDLGAGNSLNLSEGGLISSGNAAIRMQNGELHSGGAELVVVNRNDLAIASTIGQTVAGSGLTKSGTGTLTLTGNNTYSGNTAINQGTLVVSSDTNLGTGSNVEFNGGTLKAAQSFSSGKGFIRGTELVGTIDTAGFDLTFSGVNVAGIDKKGAGTLMLTAPAAGTAFISEGTLALPNATSGNVYLRGGTLLTAGALTSLDVNANAELDLGGRNAAILETGSVRNTGSDLKLTIRFGVGSNAANNDLLRINSLVSSFGADSILFDFEDLGGATAGTNYTLISLGPFGAPPSATTFDFAPAATAEGWSGTFSVVSRNVVVNFTNVPEPSTGVLFCLGLLGVLGRRYRSTSSPP